MLEFIVIVFLGVLTGVFTGLTPGIHPNTVVFGSMPIYFSIEIDFIRYMSFVAGLSVSHTFLDFLPTIFFGVAEAETALSSIPGVEMSSRGRGIEAFNYTVYGGMISVLIFLASVPLILIGLETVYSFLKGFMEYLLLFFLFFIIFGSGSFLKGSVTASLSGLLGVMAFSLPVNQQYVLLPVFSGLFALPALFMLFKSDSGTPDQNRFRIRRPQSLRGGMIGFLAGLFAGVFPGLGAAASTSFLSPFMEESETEFLAGMGAVNTSDILVSFLNLLVLGKARSGASVALSSLSEVRASEVFFLIGSSIFAVALSVPIALTIPNYVVLGVQKLDLTKVILAVIAIILTVNFILTGGLGVLILLVSGLIGYSSAISETRKACMAVLILPAIMFFAGLNSFI